MARPRPGRCRRLSRAVRWCDTSAQTSRHRTAGNDPRAAARAKGTDDVGSRSRPLAGRNGAIGVGRPSNAGHASHGACPAATRASRELLPLRAASVSARMAAGIAVRGPATEDISRLSNCPGHAPGRTWTPHGVPSGGPVVVACCASCWARRATARDMSRDHRYCRCSRRRAGCDFRPVGAVPHQQGPAYLGGVAMSKAKEIMHRGAECVAASETLETAARMMRDNHFGALPICGLDRPRSISRPDT